MAEPESESGSAAEKEAHSGAVEIRSSAAEPALRAAAVVAVAGGEPCLAEERHRETPSARCGVPCQPAGKDGCCLRHRG